MLLLLLLLFVRPCASETLPQGCPLSGPYAPGDVAPPLSIALVGGGEFSLPAPPLSLPLVVMVVDADTDPEGVVLASDSLNVGEFLAEPPPTRGTFLFISGSTPGGGAALSDLYATRLAFLPPSRAAAWRSRLAFSERSLEELRAAESPLAAVLGGWQSPRVWVEAAGLPPQSIPRVDADFECFRLPPISGAFPLSGPFPACAPAEVLAAAPAGSLLLLLNASGPGGSCDAVAAATTAFARAPSAAGAIVAVPEPAFLTPRCFASGNSFAPFFPTLVSPAGGAALAARAAAGVASVTLDATCAGGTWLAVSADGRLATVGWRKYLQTAALRWALDAELWLEGERVAAGAGAPARVTLVPRGSTLNAFSSTVALDAAALVRSRGGARLELSLLCPGVGDAGCGEWDRIVSAYARCWPAGGNASAATPPLLEIARYITPFRRSSGRWLTPGDALVGLAATAAAAVEGGGAVCEVATSSCCEQWLGELTLLLGGSYGDGSGGGSGSSGSGRSSGSSSSGVGGGGGGGGGGSDGDSCAGGGGARGAAASATVPVAFANTQTRFDGTYNANRTFAFTPPPAFSRAVLTVIISGHGSDDPPPNGFGCEFAPTSHAFTVGTAGGALAPIVVNSSASAEGYAQFMLADSELSCNAKISDLGVTAGQHGTQKGGRNGWCPGAPVWPLQWDVTPALAPSAPATVHYAALSYWVGGTHASSDGCGGDIYLTAAIVFYAPCPPPTPSPLAPPPPLPSPRRHGKGPGASGSSSIRRAPLWAVALAAVAAAAAAACRTGSDRLGLGE